MFELTETIDMLELEGGNDNQVNESIKGGFPRIKICDEEFIRKINERKPREFSNKDVLTIKEIIKLKKTEPLFDFLTESVQPVNIDSSTMTGGTEKKINGISIDTIIGKKFSKK